ncbi:hypothetical protein O7606_04715 [Micromonospora sp. WMMD882]|uniref:GHMP family kinase ATP-binding protein n=1 Tax=Micromonospora sp. WMMD882 TaxID=3015151 RepID=UPI00248C4B52|nr:hypothetical protein [Micromonospora sp. WMMD882]WBB80700.1 hypothetical protein O7606_04715 [Micromonospora sp. WMMD882]
MTGPAGSVDRTGRPGGGPRPTRLPGPAGVGHATGHHGEILQGVFLDADGRPCRGLVTLPLPDAGSAAAFVRRPGSPATGLDVVPADRHKARRAAAIAVRACAGLAGERPCGGRLWLRGSTPVGIGMGSSTSDVIAAIRAVAASFAVRLPPETVARIAVRAERACDPLMRDDTAALFDSRRALVLEEFGRPLPAAVVLSCVTGGGRPVDTLALPTPPRREAPAFEELRAALRRAVRDADLALLGQVSTESARRNQRLLPKPELATLERVADRTGAVGVQVAHSGNVAGLLFAPDPPDLSDRLRRAVAQLTAYGLPVGRIFDISAGRQTWCTTTSPTRWADRTWSGSTTD